MSARHNLAWLTRRGWLAASARVSPDHLHALALWQQQDWPVVVRRAEADALDSEVCVGLALPPDAQGQKLRIAFKVDATDVRLTRAPLNLHEAISAAHPSWQLSLRAMAGEAQAYNLDIRVYGSLPLQALTGCLYLRSTSDIDLLFRPLNRSQLETGMALIAHYSTLLPLDGEVVFTADQAVAWKEWRLAGRIDQRVLVKGNREVRLQRVDTLLAALDAAATAGERACLV
jgi:phosphoribosyl-dephospho-CoA transferase